MNQPKDSKPRLILAWLSWILMLSGGGILVLSILVFSVLFYLGGTELVSQVWSGTENKAEHDSSIIFPLIFISIPIGGKIGIWLWTKFARKIKLVSDAQIKKWS